MDQRAADQGLWLSFHPRAHGEGQAIINAFYGADPDRSYFVACSTGGRQGFMEAQRYPDDYDGIIAGAPVYRVIELRARHVWTWQCNLDPTGAHAIPASKLPAIFRAVIEACDHLDGLVDGQVDDPRRCRFNPKTLLCTDADNDTCLTAPQIETLKCMYAGPPVNPRTRKQVYPGVPPTSELDQGQSIGAVPNPQYTTFFQNTVFEDPNYDFLTFRFDSDVKFSLNKKFDSETLEFIHHAEDPDLTAFKKRGGKMIVWHGFSDPLPNPVDTIDYYNRIRAGFRHGRGHADKTEEFVRLFLLPNVGHCGGAAPAGPIHGTR